MLDAGGVGCQEPQHHHLPRERHDAILGRGPTAALSVRIARARPPFTNRTSFLSPSKSLVVMADAGGVPR